MGWACDVFRSGWFGQGGKEETSVSCGWRGMRGGAEEGEDLIVERATDSRGGEGCEMAGDTRSRGEEEALRGGWWWNVLFRMETRSRKKRALREGSGKWDWNEDGTRGRSGNDLVHGLWLWEDRLRLGERENEALCKGDDGSRQVGPRR